MSNQKEIDAWDQHIWRQKRHDIYTYINQWCHAHSIGFTDVFDRIASSRQDKIVFMLLWDRIPQEHMWNRLTSICPDKMIFVITDNIIDLPSFDNIKFISLPKLLSIISSYDDHPLVDREPKKLFSCFMQRTDMVRQTWLYFLHSNNLIDKGSVSFLLKQTSDYSDLTGAELFSYVHKKYRLGDLPHFEQAYQQLVSQVPMRTFQENGDLINQIESARYSLVLETYAVEDDTNIWCWTEKSLRDIQFAVTPLLFVQKQGIQKLRTLGLALPDFLSEIDLQPWQKRQQILLDILIRDSEQEPWQERHDRALHNRDMMNHWRDETSHKNFWEPVFELVKSQ